MRTVTRPRGRLPARVYWFRRSMVLLTALALVFAVGRLLSSGGGTAGAGDTAAATASSPTTTATQAVAGPLPIQPTGQAKQPAPSATGTPVVLAVPDGPGAVAEVAVTPSVPVAVAGGRVGIVLELTGIKPACTFTVSNST